MLTNLIKKEPTVFKYMRGTAGTDALITNYSSMLLKLIAQRLLLSKYFETVYRQGIKEHLFLFHYSDWLPFLSDKSKVLLGYIA